MAFRWKNFNEDECLMMVSDRKGVRVLQWRREQLANTGMQLCRKSKVKRRYRVRERERERGRATSSRLVFFRGGIHERQSRSAYTCLVGRSSSSRRRQQRRWGGFIYLPRRSSLYFTAPFSQIPRRMVPRAKQHLPFHRSPVTMPV